MNLIANIAGHHDLSGFIYCLILVIVATVAVYLVTVAWLKQPWGPLVTGAVFVLGLLLCLL